MERQGGESRKHASSELLPLSQLIAKSHPPRKRFLTEINNNSSAHSGGPQRLEVNTVCTVNLLSKRCSNSFEMHTSQILPLHSLQTASERS